MHMYADDRSGDSRLGTVFTGLGQLVSHPTVKLALFFFHFFLAQRFWPAVRVLP